MLTPPQPPARRRGPLLTAVAFVIVAAGVAGWALASLVSANGDLDDARRATAEDEVRLAEVRADLAAARDHDELVRAANKAIAVLNTMDYRDVDADLAEWADVTTGDLHEEIASVNPKSVADAKSVAEGTVVSTAVRELDPRAGTATVLAAVTVSVSTNGQEATDRHQRMEATLRRTDEGWKLDSIGQVPYAAPAS